MDKLFSVNLEKLRDEAWKHFVRSDDRRAFAEDTMITKIHPLTGESIGEYMVIGHSQFASSSSAEAWKTRPSPLSRDEWTAVLCTGRCQLSSKKGPRCGPVARCMSGFGPLLLLKNKESGGGVGCCCLAEAFQLHPQAELLWR